MSMVRCNQCSAALDSCAWAVCCRAGALCGCLAGQRTQQMQCSTTPHAQAVALSNLDAKCDCECATACRNGCAKYLRWSHLSALRFAASGLLSISLWTLHCLTSLCSSSSLTTTRVDNCGPHAAFAQLPRQSGTEGTSAVELRVQRLEQGEQPGSNLRRLLSMRVCDWLSKGSRARTCTRQHQHQQQHQHQHHTPHTAHHTPHTPP